MWVSHKKLKPLARPMVDSGTATRVVGIKKMKRAMQVSTRMGAQKSTAMSSGLRCAIAVAGKWCVRWAVGIKKMKRAMKVSTRTDVRRSTAMSSGLTDASVCGQMGRQ